MSRFSFFSMLVFACLLGSQCFAQFSGGNVIQDFPERFDIRDDGEFNLYDLNDLSDKNIVGYHLVDNVLITPTNAHDLAKFDIDNDDHVSVSDLDCLAEELNAYLHRSARELLPPDCVTGEVTLDGIINNADVIIVVNSMTNPNGAPGENEPGTATWLNGDFTGDGNVDAADIEKGYKKLADIVPDDVIDHKDAARLSLQITAGADHTPIDDGLGIRGDWDGNGVLNAGFSPTDMYFNGPQGGGGDFSTQLLVMSILLGVELDFGDANLDGLIDAADYTIWDNHKFTTGLGYGCGDFNLDGVTDVQDENLRNENTTPGS